LLLPILVLFAALTLAACGGSDESDEDKIVDVIETSATTSDPSNCTDLQTVQFNEQSTQESGDAATKECEEEAKDEESADSAEVSEVEVDGDTASAVAALTGGDLDGQTLEIELVKDGGDWKLNELTGFVDFDAAKVVALLVEGLEEEDSIEPELASCIGETIEESSDSELEGLILNTSGAGFAEIVEGCQE
jgi:hypothetical protein